MQLLPLYLNSSLESAIAKAIPPGSAFVGFSTKVRRRAIKRKNAFVGWETSYQAGIVHTDGYRPISLKDWSFCLFDPISDSEILVTHLIEGLDWQFSLKRSLDGQWGIFWAESMVLDSGNACKWMHLAQAYYTYMSQLEEEATIVANQIVAIAQQYGVIEKRYLPWETESLRKLRELTQEAEQRLLQPDENAYQVSQRKLVERSIDYYKCEIRRKEQEILTVERFLRYAEPDTEVQLIKKDKTYTAFSSKEQLIVSYNKQEVAQIVKVLARKCKVIMHDRKTRQWAVLTHRGWVTSATEEECRELQDFDLPKAS